MAFDVLTLVFGVLKGKVLGLHSGLMGGEG